MPPAKKAAAKRSPPRAAVKASAAAKRPTKKSLRKASRAPRTARKPAPARPAAPAPARKAAAAKRAKKPTPRKAAPAKAPRKKAGRKAPAQKRAQSTLRFGTVEPEVARRTTRLLESVTADRVLVENVNRPGYTTTVDGPKYRAVRRALLKVLPKEGRGLTQNQMFRAVKPHLPEKLFPGGADADWWTECVLLDLEAKGDVVRDADAKPLRWRSAAGSAAGAKATAAPPVRKRPLDRLKSAIIEREMTEAAAKQSREKPVPTASDLPGTLGTVPAPLKRLPAKAAPAKRKAAAKKAPPAKRKAAAKKAPPAKRKAAAKKAPPAKRKAAAKKARRR